MKLIDSLQRRTGLTVVALVLACVAFIGIAGWRALADRPGRTNTKEASEAKAKRSFHERLGRGVGRIRLAKGGDSSEKVRESVDATADFIFERSNLKMSDETKHRLARVEEDTLKGKTPRLSLDALTDTLTNITVERAKTISDREINKAAESFQETATGELISRADGKWGAVSKDEFQQQMRSAREWARRGDTALREAVRPLMAAEVQTRADNLSEALPDQFGRIKTEGVTPVQAALIGYSMAADDSLDGSVSDTTEQVVKRRIETGQKKSGKPDSHKPYGFRGALFASPAHLLLDKATSKRLLDQYEGGKK